MAKIGILYLTIYRFPLELQFRLFLMVDVGRPAAVDGVADGGVFGQLVLQIHHRLGAPDEQDGVAVVQPPHLIRGQQFSATLSSGELKETPHNSKLCGVSFIKSSLYKTCSN